MNCKPGDLAYLSSELVNAGAIVEVLRPFDDCFHLLAAWWVKSSRPLSCTLGRTGVTTYSAEFCVEDRHLRPISGVPVAEEKHDEVTA